MLTRLWAPHAQGIVFFLQHFGGAGPLSAAFFGQGEQVPTSLADFGE